jgi:arginase
MHPGGIAVCGAASSIGIRPYDDVVEARWLDRAPAALRRTGLVERLGGEDLGDVSPAAYRDFVRPRGIRNEPELVEYSIALAGLVGRAVGTGRFTLVLGGDCSIVLGSLLGARRHVGRLGLVYIDAHDDFATPEESLTGSAASMCLGLAAGRGDTPLARLGGGTPLVEGSDVVLVGRRVSGEPASGEAALRASGLLELDDAHIASAGAAATAAAALERVTGPGIDGFWVHLDADVIDPAVLPAVDSPEPGGLGLDKLASLLAPLVRHPRAVGLQFTIYDPRLDEDGTCAARLAALLEAVLAPRADATRSLTSP